MPVGFCFGKGALYRIGRKVGKIVAAVSLLAVTAGARPPADSPDVRYRTQTVRAAGRAFLCHVVTVSLASGRLVPRVLIARDGIGRTEAFGSMARRARAVAAINGSFFEAYQRTGDKDPDMTLIQNGHVVHKGGIGTVLGFGPQGPVMGRLELPIRGTVLSPGHRILGWYAHWINRTPSPVYSVVVYTSAHGRRTRVSDGLNVVVEQGEVTRLANNDVDIPTDGYVIHFGPQEAAEAAKFVVGAEVRIQVERVASQDEAAWQEVTEAVGAGPRLLTDGAITLHPQQEGFADPKILTNRGQRSAVGITGNGALLLVTVGGATIRELAEIMRTLGAQQAMNMDGGASSGLYVQGRMITPPGRALSNALAFVTR